MCEQAGLAFISAESFQTFYERHAAMPEYENLLRRMGVIDEQSDSLSLDDDECETANIYTTFCFRKK